MKKQNGITLIALVITIIVLIILAGVAINLTLGDNGILNKAKYAKELENESAARERLELALVEANIEKQGNVDYNKEEFLTQMLEDKNMIVSGDFIIVDNYTYLIDREKLIIVDSEGETTIQIPTEVIKYLGANENGKYEVTSLLKLESNNVIKSIILNRPDGITEEISLEEAVVGKEITMELDVEYEVLITDNEGKTEKRKIVEPSIENIRTVEELVEFRDKVNSGLTYEGKTINVLNDLDLSKVCGEEKGSWTPISTYISDSKVTFKATFDGKNHKISNIYINATVNYQGLFATNAGIIQNIILENVNIVNTKYCTSALVAYNIGEIKNVKVVSGNITGNENIAGIVARNYGGYMENCENRAKITYGNYGSNCGWRSGGIAGNTRGIIKKCINYGEINGTYMTGGIVGVCDGGTQNKIEECVNYADIITPISLSNAKAGGIVGVMAYNKSGEIINCYNTGSVTARMSGGIIGMIGSYKCTITNCYNIGTIIGTYKGAMAAEVRGTMATTNTYYLDTCGATDGNTSGIEKITREQFLTLGTTLGDAYIDDEEIKDEQGNGTGEYKYNNGYPILRWQIGL